MNELITKLEELLEALKALRYRGDVFIAVENPHVFYIAESNGYYASIVHESEEKLRKLFPSPEWKARKFVECL